MPQFQQQQLLQHTGDVLAIAWIAKRFILSKKRKRSAASASTASVESRSIFYDGFSADLRYLLRICFPSRMCKEAMLSVAFAVVLLARTLLSLVVAELDGYLAKHLINRNKNDLIKGGAMWLGIALPSSLINALIRYLQQRLSLSLRERLNAHIQDLYFQNDAYYKISHHLADLPNDGDGNPAVAASPALKGAHQGGKKRVIQYPPNTEQAVTEGVAQWSDRFTDVISSLGKPLFDVTLFTAVLTRLLGVRSQLYATMCIWESSALLQSVRPSFSAIVQQRSDLESRLRAQHTRVVTNGEEIAFYGGERKEAELLKGHFEKVQNFTLRTLRRLAVYQTLEDFLTKYVWICIGLVQVAVPLLAGEGSAGDNAKYFISVRRVMSRGGDATERLLQGLKDIGELAGFTRNLMNTINLLRHLNESSLGAPVSSAAAGGAEVTESDDIVVRDLPLLTPTGDTLIEKMNLTMRRSDRLLIIGPNGCGKSSLFRVLCGLWTARGGSIAKPRNRTDMLFLPQRPYMVPGTLLDQVVYPLTEPEALLRCRERHDREDLEALVLELIEIVDSSGLLTLHGGLRAEKDWAEVLSGGEKQRIGLARVLFHRPKYAILDECNSTINVEAEQRIFDALVKVEGMGLITISHRHTLYKYHSKFLTYDGCGGYTFHDTSDETLAQMDGKHREKANLVALLMEVCKELGESWPETASAAAE